MIHDPRVEVTCDGNGCTESLEIQPNYDLSGMNGSYDCSDYAIEKQIKADGWSVEDGNHYCESCTEERNSQ